MNRGPGNDEKQRHHPEEIEFPISGQNGASDRIKYRQSVIVKYLGAVMKEYDENRQDPQPVQIVISFRLIEIFSFHANRSLPYADYFRTPKNKPIKTMDGFSMA